MTDFDKITDLLLSMQPENLDLAFDLAQSLQINLRPIYDQLARVLSDASFQANVGWMNLPLPILLPQIQRIFTLSIEHSTMPHLPTAFGLLQGIYLLEIAHSDIAQIPDSFGCLHRLVSCSFVDCPLSNLPPTLCKIPKLQSLSLRQTQLQALPDCIAHCTQLRTLDLSQNPQLKTINFDLLHSLPNLQSLLLDVHHHAALPTKWHPITKWN